MRLVGVHLQQTIDLIDARRPSAVAELNADGALVGLAFAVSDAEIIDAAGGPPALVAVDAPLTVTNETGRRDLDHLLAWCDVPVFPASRRRLTQVHGGIRGPGLRVAATAAHLDVVETVPDLALRLLSFCDEGGPSGDLAADRARWVGIRPPQFRPKRAGRARAQGILAAAALLRRHVDLGGWAPLAHPDDWSAIRDAAAVDAIACAWVAHRAAREPGGVLRLGDVLLPVDGHLRTRIEINLARLAGSEPHGDRS